LYNILLLFAGFLFFSLTLAHGMIDTASNINLQIISIFKIHHRIEPLVCKDYRIM